MYGSPMDGMGKGYLEKFWTNIQTNKNKLIVQESWNMIRQKVHPDFPLSKKWKL